MGTKNNPGTFDCYANAKPDEPMFVLLARDKKAPEIVRAWADRYYHQCVAELTWGNGTQSTAAQQLAPNVELLTQDQYRKYTEALGCARNMELWRERENSITPDTITLDQLKEAVLKRLGSQGRVHPEYPEFSNTGYDAVAKKIADELWAYVK